MLLLTQFFSCGLIRHYIVLYFLPKPPHLRPTNYEIRGLVDSQNGANIHSSVPTSLHYLATYLYTSVVDFIYVCHLVESALDGTARGSVLGPLIYIIYVNDILRVITRENNIYKYADNMLIMAHEIDMDVMQIDLQNKLSSVRTWCKYNKLTINREKN